MLSSISKSKWCSLQYDPLSLALVCIVSICMLFSFIAFAIRSFRFVYLSSGRDVTIASSCPSSFNLSIISVTSFLYVDSKDNKITAKLPK